MDEDIEIINTNTRSEKIKNFFKKNKHVILKPIHSFGGNDIHLLSKFDLKFIKKFS